MGTGGALADIDTVELIADTRSRDSIPVSQYRCENGEA